jgi:putative ABC transport system permease protein
MVRLPLDLKMAVRSVVRGRFVSVLAILAFALGIGVTTAVFTVFNAVILRPLPYPDSDRLVAVYGTQPSCATCPASFPKYNDWKTRNQVFSAMGGSTPASFVMTGQGEPTRISAMATTASLADVLRVAPEFGRWYTGQEDQFGGPTLAVLSHAFSMKHFKSGRDAIGQTLTLDGAPYEIVGVMPEGFTYRAADVFVPLQRKLDPATRGNHFLSVYARLRDGVTLERATAEMRTLGTVLAREFGHNHGIDVRSYYEVVVGGVRTPLLVLLATVFFVLLIACANVANLTLASSLARRRELAVRLALGAGPLRIASQLVAETTLLAVAGGVGGIVLAYGAVRTFVYLAGTELPRAATVRLDVRALAFAAVASLGVGVLCGLWPLAILKTRELLSAVREGDARTGTPAGRRFGGALVVIEMAVAFTLLVGAGLLLKNLVLLRARDIGFRTERTVAFDLALAGPRYKADEQVTAFYRDLYARLSRVGTVESAGLVSHLPMRSFGYNGDMSIEGGNPWPDSQAPLVEYRWLYGQYLKTLGIPLLKGRPLDDRDGGRTTTVLVNRAMADKFWPGQDPIGKRFGQGRDTSGWYQVVGVVGNVRSYGLAVTAPYEFYRTLDQDAFPSMTVVVRTRAEDAESIIPTARRIVGELDPTLPVTNVQTLDEVVSASVGEPRLMSALTGLFGALAGLLAMVGVYGVTAYNVRRQRREFGIRLALGASRATLGRLVVGRTLVLTGMGVGVGAFGAWAMGRVLRTMLNDVRPGDPWVFAATAGSMVAVALLAAAIPARAAGRVDPIVALRDN